MITFIPYKNSRRVVLVILRRPRPLPVIYAFGMYLVSYPETTSVSQSGFYFSHVKSISQIEFCSQHIKSAFVIMKNVSISTENALLHLSEWILFLSMENVFLIINCANFVLSGMPYNMPWDG